MKVPNSNLNIYNFRYLDPGLLIFPELFTGVAICNGDYIFAG